MKRIFFVFLILLLSLGVLCACNGDGNIDGENTDGGNTDTGDTDGENADGGDTEPAYFTEGLSFTVLQNGTCVLTGTGTATDTDVVIPAEHEGKPVVAIGNSVFGKYKGLKSVTVPASVKEIREAAFSDCVTLETVIFAEGSLLESVGEEAFYYCGELKSITIPASVKSIATNAFYSCKKLASVTFAEGSVLEKIEKLAFSDCAALRSVSVPASVTRIGASAFAKCEALESVTLTAGGLTVISDSAFQYCASLNEIIVPEGVKTLGDNAFRNSGIRSVSLPATLETVGESALAECKSLGSIAVAEDNAVFYSAGNCLIHREFKAILAGCNDSVIPMDHGIRAIDAGAFRSCEELKRVVIPATVERIGGYAFYYCKGLSSLTFEEGCVIRAIGANAFESCTSLTEIVFPATLESIGNYGFQFCTALKSVLFGKDSQLRSFSAYAFYQCRALELIMIPKNVNSIGKRAFELTGIKAVYLCSYTVSGMLTDKDACTGLFKNAVTVAVSSDITNPTDYFTANYTVKSEIVYQGVAYTACSKRHTHAAESAWVSYGSGGCTGKQCSDCRILKDSAS